MKTPAVLPLLPLVLGLLPVLASAQHHGGWHRGGGPRVILYEHADFRGDSITLHAGEAIANLDGVRFEGGGRANDRISSIRVEGGAEALVYLDARYRGEVLRVTRDIRNLADLGVTGRVLSWNDLISSVRVDDRRDGPRPRPGRPGGFDPDKVIARAYQDILRRNVDETGLRDFRSRMIDQGWSEQMVRDSLRRSEEYRTTVVEGIVRRAYRDLLGREADGGGLRHYVYQLVNRGWSEEDVRQDIRRSAEYRQRTQPPRTAVPRTPEFDAAAPDRVGR